MIPFNYTLSGKTCHARWYANPDRISIFLNKISESNNPDDDFEGFISEICSSEFHELAHIYGFRNGCHPSKNCPNKCYLCKLTDLVFVWFKYGKWIEASKAYLKYGIGGLSR